MNVHEGQAGSLPHKGVGKELFFCAWVQGSFCPLGPSAVSPLSQLRPFSIQLCGRVRVNRVWRCWARYDQLFSWVLEAGGFGPKLPLIHSECFQDETSRWIWSEIQRRILKYP